jgi:DNA-binding NtrC family response regulator
MKTLQEIEKEVILERLAAFNGNKTKTAQSLGVTLKTIYNKLEVYAKEGQPKEIVALEGTAE